MRFTQRLEAEILQTLRNDNDVCIVFPDDAYDKAGGITIYRHYRHIRLHRYLAAQLGIEVKRYGFMVPNCETTGCMNPYHRKATDRALGDRCPNGHRYVEGNVIDKGPYRCMECREARNARRRKGSPFDGKHCGKGLHLLTDDNVYWYTDVRGHRHRRCRKCTIETMRKRRAREHEG